MAMFPAGTERRVIPDAGHFLPREQPAAVVDALLSLLARTAR
jgi:pimeloyl-ACP methyl ester carboxylesterase